MTKRVGKNVNKRKENYKKIYNFYRCSDRFLIFVNIFIHLSEEIKKVSFILQRTNVQQIFVKSKIEGKDSVQVIIVIVVYIALQY